MGEKGKYETVTQSWGSSCQLSAFILKLAGTHQVRSIITMTSFSSISTIFLVAVFLLSSQAQAFNFQKDDFRQVTEADSFEEMVAKGKNSFQIELMQSDVSQDFGEVDRGGEASTLRSRFTFESAQYRFFSFLVEFDDVTALPDDSSYNSGANGETDDALIPAHDDTYVRRAWLGYDIANTLIKYGRQNINLNNGRFIGTETAFPRDASFSALTVRNESLNLMRFRLGHIYQYESAFGREVEGGRQALDANYLTISYRGFLHSLLSLYHYDIDAGEGFEQWDSQTSGVRFSGFIDNEPAIEYALEYASQRDGHDNTRDYSAAYYLLEAGVTFHGIRIFAGREVLGADDDEGFVVTPLGELHAFQGGADIFSHGGLGNIEGGLVDDYVSLGYVLDVDSKVLISHHTYEADESGANNDSLGREWRLEAHHNWNNLDFILDYASYTARSFGVDTQSWRAGLQYNF